MFKLSTVFRYLTGQAFNLYIDSGGGGGGPTQTTNVTTNIPEYARPYVETMLGAAQNELFNYEETPTTDEYGNVTTTKTPTSLKGYQAFSPDVSNYFAGFQPLQQQAFGAAQGMAPAGQINQATGLASQIGERALGTAYNPMEATAQQFGTQQASQYMSPYLEAALNPQIAAAQRQSQIEGQKQMGEAVGRGAYGGSRDALMRMERERGLAAQIEGIRGKGYQDAFTNAQAQFNADQSRAMQAQQANIGQQQFGANLGLQGLQAAGQAASTLGTLGGQQFGQQQAAIDMQSKLGAQQQQLEQAKIDQQIKDYANQQQWAMQQLGNMSNLLRGLPMQSTTTSAYQAAPALASQLAGAGTAAIGAAKLAGARSGGSTKDIKKRGSGGIEDLGMYNAMK